MGQNRRVIISWVDAIGAASRWSSLRVIYYLTSAWKRRRDMEKQSGKAIFPGFGLGPTFIVLSLVGIL